MKSTGILLVFSACLMRLGFSYELVQCDELSRNICNLFSGDGRVCGCDNTTSISCSQGFYDYHGPCLDVVYTDLCLAFCASNGHICKGDVNGTCNEYENGDSS